MTTGILKKAFNIRRDEYKKAKYLIAFFFCVGFYFTFVGSISISVFDIRFGARYIPYVFFIFPLLNFAFSYVYMKVLPKISKRTLYRCFMLLLLFVHGFNVLILNGVFPSKIYFAVFLLLCILVNEKLYFISMMLIQDVVDIESIKRILPMSTAVFTVASIIAAFSIRELAGTIPAGTLFLASGGFLFLMAFFADMILKRYRSVPETAANMKDEGLKDTLRYIGDNSFIFLLILLAIVVDIVFNINDYLYNVIASGAIPEEARFVGYVGTTETFRYILTLFIDLFLFTRIITRMGSLNAVKIVFINAILGTSLLILGSSRVYAVMASKIIFTVLVMLLSYSLVQILYQPVLRRYKEKVMVTADVVVSFAGSIIGGVVTLLHSYGLLNTVWLNVLIIAAALFMLVLWQLKQSGFIKIIEGSMNYSESMDLGKMFGEKGLEGLGPYLEKKVMHGSSFERILALDILRHADFEGRTGIFENAVLRGDLEIKMKIIDMAFDGGIPLKIITDSCKSFTSDKEALQYLLYNMFLSYKTAGSKLVSEVYHDIKDTVDKENLGELQQWMFEYLFEGKRDAYGLIIQHLAASGKSGDLSTMLRIMLNFTGAEDDVNRSALASVMLNLKGYQGILMDTVELCSIYDREMDMMYLKEVFSGYCQTDVIEKICTCYSPGTVIRSLKDSSLLIPKTYALLAATMETEVSAADHYGIYLEVKERLEEMVVEKLKIEKSMHTVKTLLLEEVERLISSVTAVLLKYIFSYYGVPEVKYLEKHLRSDEGKKMICEIVQNSLPLKVSREILPIMDEDLDIAEEKYDYRVLILGGMHQILANLYMIIGGEIMEEKFGREIETIAILKATSVFKGLDIESLYELLRVGEFVGMEGGNTIVNKGEPGSNLYVVIEGEAGVYGDAGEECFATVENGDMFGEEDVIGCNPRITTVKTFDDTVLFRIRGEDFVSLLKTNNELAFSLLKVLAEHLRSAMTEN